MVKWQTNEERNQAATIHSQLGFANTKSEHTLNMERLTLLLRARQMCVLPSLTGPIDEYCQDDDEGNPIMKPISYRGVSTSKIAAVVNHITNNNNNQSRLVFCHYRGEIDELSHRLTSTGLDIKILDGRTSRQDRVNILNSTCDVLILQIQTGCEGLNLQQFNEVYFVSPHWNPAVEDQAIARCHRIGQEREVKVFKFYMEGFKEDCSSSLDMHAHNRQDEKREIAESLYNTE
jgi:SNF2 family DNA or RNA helicase